MKVSASVVALMPLLLLLSGAAARDLSNPGFGRSLLLASCDATTCDKCVSQGTGAGKKCKICKNNMVVLRSSDSAVDGSCGCLAGTYFTAPNTCTVCPKDSFCPGGTPAASITVSCGNNMQTLSTGAKKATACVNSPGFYYVKGTGSDPPTAVACGADTYSPGLKQQQQCRKCPSGFKTNAAPKTSIAACFAPPGYYVNAAGVAVACPKGEWKAGYDTATFCTRCITGVTTEGPGKTAKADCNTLRPGFQGQLNDAINGITSPELCARDSYCSGVKLDTVDVGVVQGAIACTNSWTQAMGSIAPSQCMVPPGYGTDGNGVLTICGSGFYREGWVKKANSIACSSCGASVPSDDTKAPVMFYDDAGKLIEARNARASSESCYIEAGYGLIKLADGSYAARACNGANEYGAPTAQYGLVAAPCKKCPFNMVTGAMAADANVDAFVAPGGLAISPDACVTQAGFGYDGRISEQCPIGTYGVAATRDPCTPCAVGKTTSAPGAIADANCKYEAGRDNTNGVLCAVGSWSAFDTACTACEGDTTTEDEGSTSAADCTLCAGGFAWNSTACIACPAGSYTSGALASGAAVACAGTCPATTFFLQGSDMLEADMPLSIPATSAVGSASAADCVASFGQLVLNEYGPIVATTTTVSLSSPDDNAAGCYAACAADANCQFVNIEYSGATIVCKKRSITQARTGGGGYTLFGVKQVPAGDVQAESQHNAKSTGNGKFTFWVDAAVESDVTSGVVDKSTDYTSAAACQDACTSNNACAGVIMTYTTGDVFGVCKHVIPEAAAAGTLASNTRTLLRADPAKSVIADVLAAVP